jgi:hypothetical protein
MKLERVFPLEDPPVDLPWGLSRSGVEAALRGAELGALPDGRLRLRCRLLGGLTTTVDLHFGTGGQRRLRQVELLRTPVRRKRQEFEDLQRRLEAWLGPSEPMESNPTAQAARIAPQQWRIGKLRVTHDYYQQLALYEKVLFDWAG